MYFHDGSGQLCTLPVRWTSLAPADAFGVAAAGRSWFRVADLVEAAALVARLRHEVSSELRVMCLDNYVDLSRG